MVKRLKYHRNGNVNKHQTYLSPKKVGLCVEKIYAFRDLAFIPYPKFTLTFQMEVNIGFLFFFILFEDREAEKLKTICMNPSHHCLVMTIRHLLYRLKRN